MENSIILEEILEELTENAKHISSSSLEKFANEIIKARHIFVAGAGRSGFVARGFANRLMHLGLEVFFVGEPTTPAIEKKDLLIISSGSGETDSLIVMANKAKKAGVDANSTLICTGHKMPVFFQSLFRPRPLLAKANSRTAS